MCGIAGILGQGDINIIKKMTQSMSYRGPDADGHVEDTTNRVYLGHRRLSILDLSGGAQPMWDHSKTFCIVFNGEIYNFGEIRNELVKLGHKFLTDHSDTEVILEAYKEWGQSCVSKFNGMWAFAIYDTLRKEVFLSRDRFGKKPLYYSYQNGNFVFASELHLFKQYPHIDIEKSTLALKKYFAYGYIPAPLSYYNNIYKLPGGHNATIKLQDLSSGYALKIHRYWDFQIEPFTSIPKNPEKVWSEELISLLDSAVKIRMISDVPLGVFLSGGVDSSSIVALASRYAPKGSLKTFSIGFSEASFDESIYAKLVADQFQTDHRTDQLSIEKSLEILPDVLARLDEPMGDASLLPTYLLTKFTRQFVTVALAGDGGDEIFAGYDPFVALSKANLYSKFIPKPIHEGIRMLLNFLPVSHRNMSLDFKIKRTLRGLSYPKQYWLPVWMGPSSLEDINQLFGDKTPQEELYSEAIQYWEDCKQENLVDKTLNFYTKMYLQDDILVKADRASMMNSLEVRAPFLDINLINFARCIPWQYKYRNGETKYILKKALEPYLPNEILYRKKKGFGVPIGKWFQEGKLQIEPSNLGVFPNSDYAKSKVSSHMKGKSDERAFLWNTMVLK
ncbi:MAG: asparagine synthase (glutamine-hydrolyzing) [Leptospira sp.]|nr:asparagine synthase (glutamine-hydrolyzing) [Leptospira sp.]